MTNVWLLGAVSDAYCQSNKKSQNINCIRGISKKPTLETKPFLSHEPAALLWLLSEEVKFWFKGFCITWWALMGLICTQCHWMLKMFNPDTGTFLPSIPPPLASHHQHPIISIPPPSASHQQHPTTISIWQTDKLKPALCWVGTKRKNAHIHFIWKL